MPFRLLSKLAKAPGVIEWTAFPDGSVDFYNRHWFRYTGMTLEESRGFGWRKAVHPDDLPKTMVTWSRSLLTGQKFIMEFRLRRADGCYRWHRAEGEPVANENGEVIKWFGIAIDIQNEKSPAMSRADTQSG